MLKARKILSIALVCAIIFNAFAIGASATLGDGQALSAVIKLEAGIDNGGDLDPLPSSLKAGDTITVHICPQTDFYCGASRYVVMFSKDYFDVVGTDQNAFTANMMNSYYQNVASGFGGTVTVPQEGWPAALINSGDYNTYSAVSVFTTANGGSGTVGYPALIPANQWLFSFNLTVKQDITSTSNARIWMDQSWFRSPADTYATAFFTKCVDDTHLAASGSSTLYNFNIDTTGADLNLKPTSNLSTITFESNGGSAVASLTGTPGTPVQKPSNPTKTNYNFINWFYDNDTFNNVVSWTNLTFPATNVTFYAKWTIKKTSITYISNGGTSVPTSSGDIGSFVTRPTNPTKANFAFENWYSDSALTQVVSWPYQRTPSNVTFYAKWVSNTSTITYDPVGGSSVASSTGTVGTTVAKPADPTKTNYTFSGWFFDSNYTQPVTWPYTRTASNVTFYAKWTANTSTITFESNGGSSVASITDVVNASITKPTDPTKTNYTFNGWFYDVNLTQPVTWPYTMTASSVTFYAKWTINTSTINFEPNGGSVVTSITGNIGDSIQKPADPTKADNIFVGWFSDVNLSNSVTWPYTLTASNVTFYAKWTPTSTITFNSDGGSSVDPITLPEGTTITKPADPTKDGYKFLGWDPAIPPTMQADNMTCVAKWGQLKTITFNSNGGSAVASISEIGGASIAKPASPTLDGYTFENWYSDKELQNVVVWPYTLNSDVTFYAKWTQNITTSTITFDAKGGTAVAPIIANVGSSVDKPTNPTREGYTFAGWYLDETLNTAVTWPYTMTKDNVTFYAKWDVKTVTITYDTRGGSYIAPKDVQAGYTITEWPTDPTKTGFVFAGWYTDTDYNWPVVLPFTVTQDITLYAKWVATFTITFDSKGGSEVTSITGPDGASISAPTPPTKDGYTFIGWYTDEGLTTAVTWPYTLTANVTFYASWVNSSTTSTITFVTGNGTPVASVTGIIGSPVPTIIDPTCLDYAFFGWSPELPLTFPSQNITVTAQWKLLGDINFDGKVNSTDVRMALKASASTLTLTADQNKVADVSHDGKVNSTDVRWILKYSAQTIQHYPDWPVV